MSSSSRSRVLKKEKKHSTNNRSSVEDKGEDKSSTSLKPQNMSGSLTTSAYSSALHSNTTSPSDTFILSVDLPPFSDQRDLATGTSDVSIDNGSSSEAYLGDEESSDEIPFSFHNAKVNYNEDSQHSLLSLTDSQMTQEENVSQSTDDGSIFETHVIQAVAPYVTDSQSAVNFGIFVSKIFENMSVPAHYSYSSQKHGFFSNSTASPSSRSFNIPSTSNSHSSIANIANSSNSSSKDSSSQLPFVSSASATHLSPKKGSGLG